MITDDDSLSSIDRAVLKQAHAAVGSLFLEAVKHDQDTASISPILEDCKFSPERITAFNNIYRVRQQPFDFYGGGGALEDYPRSNFA